METTDGTLFAQDGRPLVAIFRSPVFNASETFVRTQAAGLERYQPLLIGLEDKGHVPEALANRIMMAHGAGERFMVRLGYWGRLGERAAAAKPVLVHAHFGTDGVLALPLARRLGVPLVTTLRGFVMSRRRLLTSGRLSWMRYALSLPGVSTVVTGAKNRAELAEAVAAAEAGPIVASHSQYAHARSPAETIARYRRSAAT